MKSICILVTTALLLAIPIFAVSTEGGPALYESNCAMCHGSKGEGNPDADMPKVRGTSMTVEQLTAYITKGDENKTIHALQPILYSHIKMGAKIDMSCDFTIDNSIGWT